jgi:hypothetical protein
MADAAAEHALSAVASLPHAVVLLIFAQLPVDLRARCSCVCRGWRAALTERSLWTRLDVSRTSGVMTRVTDALLRGAAARAGGELEALDVSRCRTVSRAALLAVVTAAAGALRRLRVCNSACSFVFEDGERPLLLDEVETLLRAAPLLRVFDADVDCRGAAGAADARRALRSEGSLAPLRVHGLRASLGDAAEADVLALAADVASHAWLRELCLDGAVATPAALDAVLDAARACGVPSLHFNSCSLTAASAPALARLLAGGAVAKLHVWRAPALLDAQAAALLAGALRANATLTSLQLSRVGLWDDLGAAAALLGALTAHPRLQQLHLSGNEVADARDCEAAGALLGALLAANAPPLALLDVSECALGDAGLQAALRAALPANTHLRTLDVASNRSTRACARDVLLPAVRANGSLRQLTTDDEWAAERQAQRIVQRRGGGGGGAARE